MPNRRDAGKLFLELEMCRPRSAAYVSLERYLVIEECLSDDPIARVLH